MMERKRECRELHEICSRLGNLGRRLRFPVYLGKELLETPIEELELSVRSFNCLRRAGMATVGDLVQNIDTREDLLKIRNLGRRSAYELGLRQPRKAFIYGISGGFSFTMGR